VTTLAYDRLGRLIGRTLPLGQTESRTYDAAGNLVATTDFNGRTLVMAYDAADRLLERTLPDGEVQRFEYTTTGQIAAMTDGTGRTVVEYDQRDRPVRLRQPGGAEIAYAYDPIGNRAAVTTPAGAVLYAYDAASRLTQVEDTRGGRVGFDYDAVGNLTGADYPGGLTTRITYDSLRRPLTITHRRGANVLASWSHEYGPRGNRTRTTDNNGRQSDYAYDALLQVISEQHSGAGLPTDSVTYAYDATGNRLSRVDAAGAIAYTYDANSRLTGAGAAVYTYDGQGNLVTRSSGSLITNYAYDGLDRLVRVQSAGRDARFAYDALGIRVQQVNDGARTSYLVDPFGAEGLPVVLAETDGAGSALADYVYAGSRLISQLTTASDTSYYLDDGTRSTRLLADSSGAVTDRYAYDAYGNLMDVVGSTRNAYLYRAQEFDAADGLYNLRARRYDPMVGRFVGRDPVSGNPLMPMTFNPYLYSLNDPVNRLDPSGRESLMSVAAASAVVNVLAGLVVGGIASYGTYELTDGNKTAAGVSFVSGFTIGFFKVGPWAYPFIPLLPQAERTVDQGRRQIERVQTLVQNTRESAAQGFKTLKSIKTEFSAKAPDVVAKALQNVTQLVDGQKVCRLLLYAESLLKTGVLVIASASDKELAREIVDYLRGTGGLTASDITNCQ
jgi:RHS repeat-associated protein